MRYLKERGIRSVFIHDMTDSECREALRRATVGRLACAKDNQPYVVPISFMIDGDHLYAFATLGQKIEWMRTNPRVCLEIDERIARERWQSVVVFGTYEELPDVPKFAAARTKAQELLQKHAMWWQPACVCDDERDTPHSDEPIAFRINITRMTGHRATPNLNDSQVQHEVELKKKDQ